MGSLCGVRAVVREMDSMRVDEIFKDRGKTHFRRDTQRCAVCGDRCTQDECLCVCVCAPHSTVSSPSGGDLRCRLCVSVGQCLRRERVRISLSLCFLLLSAAGAARYASDGSAYVCVCVRTCVYACMCVVDTTGRYRADELSSRISQRRARQESSICVCDCGRR